MRSNIIGSSRSIRLGLLLLICTSYQCVPSSHSTAKESAAMSSYDPNQSVSSEQFVSLPLTAVTPPVAMIIEGTVEQVMETSPLQLTVTTDSGRYYVALQSSTAVTQQGHTVNPDGLKPGVCVHINGQPSNFDNMALTAQDIKIRS
jgi:hypothetical protein